MANNGDGSDWKENLNVRLKCPDCKEDPPNLIEEDSSTVCASCGVVLADRIISMESEWRTFSNDDGKNSDDPSRVGEAANDLLNGNQLETGMSWAGNGGRIARDLQRAQSRQLENKSNKALQQAYMDIDQKCDAYGIQHNVKTTAKTYYKATQDAKAFKGKPLEVVIAGCIFLACRQCNVGRSFNEIFSMTSVPKKEIGRIYKQLEKFLYTNSESRTNAVVDGGGRSKSFHFLVLAESSLQVLPTLMPSTSRQLLRSRRSSVRDFAIVSTSVSKSSPGLRSFPKKSPTEPSQAFRVALRSVLCQPAFISLAIWPVRERAPKRSQGWPKSVMARFARLTSSCCLTKTD